MLPALGETVAWSCDRISLPRKPLALPGYRYGAASNGTQRYSGKTLRQFSFLERSL